MTIAVYRKLKLESPENGEILSWLFKEKIQDGVEKIVGDPPDTTKPELIAISRGRSRKVWVVDRSYCGAWDFLKNALGTWIANTIWVNWF